MTIHLRNVPSPVNYFAYATLILHSNSNNMN